MHFKNISRRSFFIGLGALVFLLVLVVFPHPATDTPAPSNDTLGSSLQTLSGTTANLSFGTTTLTFELARTPAERELGLSGHAPLTTDHGMLFIFEQPAKEGFWMKDMFFSLDIIWLDANLRVITIAPNARPDSYPEVFYPATPSSYVLELPAGYAKAHGIVPGSQFTFPAAKN